MRVRKKSFWTENILEFFLLSIQLGILVIKQRRDWVVLYLVQQVKNLIIINCIE